MLPTNAKMTAFVCSGRSRPNDSIGCTFAPCQASWSAATTPTSMPTMPQRTDASANLRGVSSSNSIFSFSVTVVLLLDGKQREAIGVIEVALPARDREEDDRRDDEAEADEDLEV